MTEPNYERQIEQAINPYGQSIHAPQPKQEPRDKPAVTALAAPGSRLEQLLAVYETEKANAAEAAARFKAVTDALKAEGSAACPGSEDVVISGAPHLPKLRLAYRRSWRLNTDKLKTEQPYLYVKYSEQSGHWEIREVQ